MKQCLSILTLIVGLAAASQAQNTPEDRALEAAQQRLGFSPAIASVVHASWASADAQPDYLLIQDVHCHGEAQGHIAQLIQLAQRTWGTRNVFVEGAFSKVDKNALPAYFQDENTWPVLTEKGQLSGTELALLQSAPDQPLELIGIDDPSLYRKSVAVYDRLRGIRPAFLQDADFIAHQNILDNLLSLQMTPASLAQFEKEKSSIAGSKSIRKAIALAEQFYAVADERSEIFLDKSSASDNTGPRVLVVGGFHTAAICARLKKENKSYVVLRPRVTRAGYQAIYEDRMKETARLLQAPQVVALNH